MRSRSSTCSFRTHSASSLSSPRQLLNDHSRSFLFNYFSLCTLTGTGYGDITPIWPGVASLTWMEAMFG